MADLEKVINGLIMHKTGLCNVLTASGKEYCPYWENNDNCMLELLNDALSLLKAQDEVITALLKVGYPHNFQREEPWIVDYMRLITGVVKKAVNLRNDQQGSH